MLGPAALSVFPLRRHHMCGPPPFHALCSVLLATQWLTWRPLFPFQGVRTKTVKKASRVIIEKCATPPYRHGCTSCTLPAQRVVWGCPRQRTGQGALIAPNVPCVHPHWGTSVHPLLGPGRRPLMVRRFPCRYYARLTMDFQTNKRVCEEVAIIPSKSLKNKIAGYTTVSPSPLWRQRVQSVARPGAA